jgi:hypothetical protein
MEPKETGYEIIVAEQVDMVDICTELCKSGFHFQAFIFGGDWHIFLTGAF